MGKNLCKQISAILSLLFLLAYFVDINEVLLVILIMEFVVISLYGLKDINRHITLLVFLVSFFTFLMGRIIVPLFMDTDSIFYEFGNAFFSYRTTKHIIVCLFIALQGIFWGYIINNKNYSRTACRFNSNGLSVAIVRKLTRNMLFCIFPFVIIELFEKIRFFLTNDYYSLYSDFKSELPYIIIIISSAFEVVFLIFLATMPTKDELKIPAALFISSGVINLGTGQRGEFVLNILLVLSYFFFRNTLDKKKKQWITKRGIFMILLLLPVLLSFLLLYAYIRTDVDMNTSYNLLLAFFYQQGVSADVIGYGFDFDHKFPEGKLYLFGDIVDYFRHNFIAKILWGAESVQPQSVTHAMNDYSFNDALTYMVKPNEYLNGAGLGGCYIAEAWHDFGFIGVFVVSFIYGKLLSIIPKWLRKNLWTGSIGLIMFYAVIYSPRSRADKPIYTFFSFVVLAVYVFIFWYVHRRKKIILRRRRIVGISKIKEYEKSHSHL